MRNLYSSTSFLPQIKSEVFIYDVTNKTALPGVLQGGFCYMKGGMGHDSSSFIDTYFTVAWYVIICDEDD